MRHKAINANRLFEAFRESLNWEWLAGMGASERRFDEMAVRSARSGADLVGYLNYIHPYRLQVLGEREIAYLTNATDEDCARRIGRIVKLEPPVLVLADGQTAPAALLSMCENAGIPMFATRKPRPLSLTCCAPTCPSTLPTAPPCTACSWTFWAWA